MFAMARRRLLSRWLGDGMTGVIGASVLGWGLRKLRDGLRRDAEVLDVSKLVPGEQYTVVTRPAPTRRERKLERKSVRADRRAAKATAPTRRQRHSAAELRRAERRVRRVDPNSARGRRRNEQLALRRAAHESSLALTPKQQRLVARRDDALNALVAAREASLTRAKRKVPPPRRRTFR